MHFHTDLMLFFYVFVFPVFIYSMPGYKCSIKERMLYSSCKNPLIDTVEKNLGIEVAKKVLYPRLSIFTAVLSGALQHK